MTTLAVVLGLCAVVVLALAGRRINLLERHTAELADAAERLGRGELEAGLPAIRGGASGRLAAALAAMRRRMTSTATDLSRREAEAEAIVTGVAEGVFTVDRERRIRYLNPQAARLLDIDPAQALGRFCGDVLRPAERGGVRPCEEHCPIVHARFRGGARATEHVTGAGAGRRTVVITSAPIAGELQVQVMRDESEIEATRRMRDAVLANISHEFRTPLSAQLASLELLLDRLPDLSTDEAAELVTSLQRGTLRLAQLVDNLIESVRIEADEADIRRVPVHLDEVVEQALELTGPLFGQRGQVVDLALPFPMPQVTGDATRLCQVLVNLLANACKYAPEGTTVTVGGTIQAGGVALWVEDQGPGLPDGADALPFTRFWRGAESEAGGAGLGLYIAKSIVERHGGRIEAKSGSGGTRMTVHLPGPA